MFSDEPIVHRIDEVSQWNPRRHDDYCFLLKRRQPLRVLAVLSRLLTQHSNAASEEYSVNFESLYTFYYKRTIVSESSLT